MASVSRLKILRASSTTDSQRARMAMDLVCTAERSRQGKWAARCRRTARASDVARRSLCNYPCDPRGGNMMNPEDISNRRILVIDDNQAIHQDFRKIFHAASPGRSVLDEVEAGLFGASVTHADEPWFEIDSAFQGQESLTLIQEALRENRPYAMAFVDVRMPPGWDGIETTKRIWEVCPDLQIVICTAYADCSWSEMHEKINPLDRLLILKKPFDPVEVIQLAHALTEKWRLMRESKTRLSSVEQMVKDRTRELEASQIALLNMMEDSVRNRRKVEEAYEELKREVTERRKLEAQFL